MIDNSAPLVSVIVPTYGRAHHIQRAIDSLIQQHYRPIEIIVVDDNHAGSPERDATNAALKKYSEVSFLRVIHRKQNGGGAAARNTGIAAASGKLITFLDDDDFYRPEKIALQVEHLVSNNLEISLCDMEILDNGTYVDEDLCYAKGVTLSEFIHGGVAYTPMIMCDSDLLRSVGGFHSTPRFQDHILMIKLLERRPRIAVLRKKLFVHNRHLGKRITSGPDFPLGHSIRIDFERRHLSEMSRANRKAVQLRHSIVGSRLRRLEHGKIAGLATLIGSTRYISGIRDIRLVTRTAARLFIRPETHF